jgi:hypothetical protein
MFRDSVEVRTLAPMGRRTVAQQFNNYLYQTVCNSKDRILLDETILRNRKCVNKMEI